MFKGRFKYTHKSNYQQVYHPFSISLFKYFKQI